MPEYIEFENVGKTYVLVADGEILLCRGLARLCHGANQAGRNML